AVGDSRFRCLVCRKLFRGPEFVHKHIKERHLDEFQPSSTGAGGAPKAKAGGFVPPGRAAPAAPSDQFFDADVAEESSARVYTSRIGLGDSPTAAGSEGSDVFSQELQDAAQAGDIARLQKSLLPGGSSVNQVDVDGTSPVHLA
ncbi:unnamed protein product, partial [Polarella glacialis]